MGADFLEKAAPSFQKCWDQGRLDLMNEDLLTRLPTAKTRSFPAKKGDKITVDKVGETLVATRGLTEVARCDDPPAQLLEALAANCGVAQGTVDEVHELAGIAEISICIANPK